MSRREFVSVYEHEEDILGVIGAARERGLTIVDVFSPYAIHGLERIAGFRPSRLPIVAFFIGLGGCAFMTWFAFWTSAVDWPVNIGGKPWNSLPAFIPVIFEITVLSAGVGTVLVLFARAKLWPGKVADMPCEGVTDNRFALILEETDATFDPDEVKRLCERYNAVHVEEREVEAK